MVLFLGKPGEDADGVVGNTKSSSAAARKFDVLSRGMFACSLAHSRVSVDLVTRKVAGKCKTISCRLLFRCVVRYKRQEFSVVERDGDEEENVSPQCHSSADNVFTNAPQ